MMDIKKFAAGVIAGAAITAAPRMAFAAPASAATNTRPILPLRRRPTAPRSKTPPRAISVAAHLSRTPRTAVAACTVMSAAADRS